MSGFEPNYDIMSTNLTEILLQRTTTQSSTVPQDEQFKDFIHEISIRLGLSTHQAKECLKIALEQIILIDEKQKDYGPRNISVFGELGIVVRMNDKFERIKNIFFDKDGHPRKEVSVSNETTEDTWRDIANYAMIALVVKRDAWLP